MKVLIYSQQGAMGGSTRLLLNLGGFLATKHEVSVALRASNSPEATRVLVNEFPKLRFVPGTLEYVNQQKFDLAIIHQPFSLDDAMRFEVGKKIAVIMELADIFPITIKDEHTSVFKKILYLHPEQVAHFSEDIRLQHCFQLPLINNIDFRPKFSKTRFLACIGGSRKTEFPDVLGFLNALSSSYGLRWWSVYPFSLRKLSLSHRSRVQLLVEQGRLQRLPVSGDIQQISRLYDVLLHMPACGNGTSVVVSDALNCGMYVVRAYGTT